MAAKSGVAQNTISQLERGERQAMPSTVRKLADALGVDPPVLMAESRINRPIETTIPPGRAEAWSKLPPEELDLLFRRERKEQERAAADRQQTRQREAPEDRSIELPVPGTLPHLSRELLKEEARVREEWYETGRWAEYYVSGELAKRARAFVEAQDVATILSREGVEMEGPLVTLLTDPEESEGQYLQDIRTALRSYTGDLAAVRSRLTSNDPREVLQAAQLVLERARRIVEEHDRYLESFRRIPDRYYARPTACARMVQLQEALSEQRAAAAEDVQTLMDLYQESLDTLEDQILEMRKESDVLEEFVRQGQKQQKWSL